MIDFKDWKKTKEDKHGVEMTHHKGHSMTLLFKGVPLVQREALKRLPLHDGGDVKGVHKSAYDSKDKELMGESEAGKQVRQADIKPKSKEKAKDEHNRVLGEMKTMPQPKLKGMATGGKASSADDLEAALEAGPDDEDSSRSATPTPQQATQAPAAPAPESASPQDDMQTTPVTNMSPNQAASSAFTQPADILNAIQSQNLANRTAIEKAHQNFAAYNASPDSQIDARQYIKQMSLPREASTAIGMFLGGFSVPFGGQNYTAKLLDDAINRNVEAQKENYQHQKNVWGAAHDLFGDEQVANNFARTVALEQASNLVRQTALAHGPDPKTAVRAQALINHNTAQQNQLKDQSAKQLTGKQVAQAHPGFWDTVKSQGIANAIAPYLPTGGPSESMATEKIQPQTSQSQQAPAPTEEIPDTGPIPQFKIDNEGIKRSQFLGAEGNIPNQITPSEVGAANDEVGKASQFNDKIKLIHQNFADLWKNRSDANQSLKYLSSLGVNLEGIHIQPPDFTTWNEGSKNYFRAANRIRQELATLVGSGGLTHEQAETVLTNLIKQNDSPEDYKNVLKQVDGNLLSNIKTPVLGPDKYDKIKRPKIAD